MAILKHDSSLEGGCQFEFSLEKVTEESVTASMILCFGHSFPKIKSRTCCLKNDLLKLLEDLTKIDYLRLSILEPHDPDLCIYCIPGYEHNLYDEDSHPLRHTLIFALDAGVQNMNSYTESGPALRISATMEQIHYFVKDVMEELKKLERQ